MILPASKLFTSEFLLLCLASLLFFASYHILSPVLPLYFKGLHFDGIAIGTLMSVFMVASLSIRPWVGKFADELNKRALMASGMVLFVLCPVLYLSTQAEAILLLLRVLHGVGFALFYTASASYLVQRLPADHKAEGLSHYSNAIKIAMAFSPGLGLFLVNQHLMHTAFWLASGFGVLTLVCILLLGLAQHPQTNATNQPATNKPKGKLFNVQAAFPGFIMATNSIAFGALIPYVPMLATEKNLTNGGLFYTVYAACLILSRSVTGPLSDRYGRSAVVLPGMAMVILTLLMLSWSPDGWVFLLASGLYGLAAGTVQPSLMAVAADKTASGEQGSAMATFTLFNDLGIAVGTFLMGSLGDAQGYGHSLLWIAAGTTFGWLLYFFNTRTLRPGEQISGKVA